MRYLVSVGALDIEVQLDGDVATVEGKSSTAQLSDLEGTPVRMVKIGDAIHRVVALRGESRGRYTLWLDGFKYEVEALDDRARAIRERDSDVGTSALIAAGSRRRAASASEA